MYNLCTDYLESNDDFKSFVSDIRMAETMSGTEQKSNQNSECHKYPDNQ